MQLAADEDGNWVAVGRITSAHGIRGWLKVQPYTEPAENILGFGQWRTGGPGEHRSIVLDRGRRQGKGFVVHIEGVDDRDAAEALRGVEIEVPEATFPALQPGEYYWRELEGLEVWCRDREPGAGPGTVPKGDATVAADGKVPAVLVGVVDHLIETGGNDVLVVRPSEGSIDDRERLVPYLPDDVVTAVDLDGGRLELSWYVDE